RGRRGAIRRERDLRGPRDHSVELQRGFARVTRSARLFGGRDTAHGVPALRRIRLLPHIAARSSVAGTSRGATDGGGTLTPSARASTPSCPRGSCPSRP